MQKQLPRTINDSFASQSQDWSNKTGSFISKYDVLESKPVILTEPIEIRDSTPEDTNIPELNESIGNLNLVNSANHQRVYWSPEEERTLFESVTMYGSGRVYWIETNRKFSEALLKTKRSKFDMRNKYHGMVRNKKKIMKGFDGLSGKDDSSNNFDKNQACISILCQQSSFVGR